MARPFPGSTLPMQKLGFLPGPITFLVVLAAVISVFSTVTFLCGSHGLDGAVKSLRRKKTVRLGGVKKPVIEKMRSGLSSKALLMVKMISWRKVQDEGEADDYGYGDDGDEDVDGVVWKKTIIKGEKCKPLDFSGKILYDADGNRLPD